MVCPDCGDTEDGSWQFGNDSAPSLSDSSIDDWTFVEDPYEYDFAEDPFGLPWFAFSGLTGGHSSFEQVESSPTPNREIPGNHAILAEHMAASPLAHSHVHVSPIPSAISDASANVVDPIFSYLRNGQSGQNELHNHNPFLATNVQYQNWGNHSTPVSAIRNHVYGVDHASVPSTLRTTGVEVDAMLRSGPSALPLPYGDTYSSFSRGRSSFVSSPNHPGRVTCPHQTVQVSQAGHPPQHNPSSLISPIMPVVRSPMALPLLAPPPQSGSNILPYSGGQNLPGENSGGISHFPVMSIDRVLGWGSQQASDGADPSHSRSGNIWPQWS